MLVLSIRSYEAVEEPAEGTQPWGALWPGEWLHVWQGGANHAGIPWV